MEAARRLHASDIDVVVNVIGFDVDAEAARQLEAVAKAGGGEYLTANSRADLDRVFSQRLGEATKRFECMLNKQTEAAHKTSNAQVNRYNCLSQKALTERNAVMEQAGKDYQRVYQAEYGRLHALQEKLNSDRSVDVGKRGKLLEEARARLDATIGLAAANRKYAQDQAQAKWKGILDPAYTERRRTSGAAYEQSRATIDDERAKYDARVQQAREEHDTGTQP